jgi:hypothetical protein
VVPAWVSLRRDWPWKSASALRPGTGGSSEPSFGRKLFIEAHASISAPSTLKCSVDSAIESLGDSKRSLSPEKVAACKGAAKPS